MKATYSPEDNKLRLYPETRLPRDLYDRVKAAGFSWAPKQELFVAPMWTPEHVDLLTELCEDGIEDEDTSLVDRAEQRAERFEDYSENRKEDAERARAAVSAIADNIPLGQPIMVGHHSERHARKDAQRIENGMRRAVKMWDTSQYWISRAKGAIHAAKYKERPDVRARRIKGLEADKRKQERNKANAELASRFWRGELKYKGESFPIIEENRERIKHIVGNSEHFSTPIAPGKYGYWSAWDILRPKEDRYSECPEMTVAEVQEKALTHLARNIKHAERWVAHISNRLAYETAMLEDAGATELLAKKPKSAAAQLPLLNYRAPSIKCPNLERANLRSANLRSANLERADLEGANLEGANCNAPITVPWHTPDTDLAKRVATAALESGALDMRAWHKCETTHCLAGWAIHLSGPLGKALEALTSPSVAGCILMPSAARLFFETNEKALQWCKEQVS